MDSLAARISQSVIAEVEGTWQRHVAARHAGQALHGRVSFARWGTADGFPVLYLGQPRASVVVEAYRHLVDPVEDLVVHALPPRVLVTCAVHVTEILDLRSAASRVALGVSIGTLQSATRDRTAYRACQEISATAHQLGLHGVITPSATQLGLTLALFTDLLPLQEQPEQVAEELWTRLPDDPRTTVRPALRVVRDAE